MIKVFQRWIDRYFSDEEAILLLVLITALLLVIISLGQVLAPFFTALVVAYLLQGSMSWLKQQGLRHLTATLVVIMLLSVEMLWPRFIILPAAWGCVVRLVTKLP